MNESFLKAIPVLEKIENAGFEAYFVGGSVRDYLLGKPISDVDIATSARPEEIKQIFIKTVDVGIEHGTVLVLFNDESYEITSFRSEGIYENFRHPKEVNFIRSLEEDLKRRDFTINAIAMTKEGHLIDPFSGQSDLQQKLIRTVGKPADRFGEDALRMMRAVRFVSQLSFRLDDETNRALMEYASLLKHIAVERKLSEFTKLLEGKNVQNSIRLLVESSIYQYLPGFSEYQNQLLEVAKVDALNKLSVDEIWSLIIIKFAENHVDVILREWKMPVKQIRHIKQIVECFNWRNSSQWDSYSVYQFGYTICKETENLIAVLNGKVPEPEILILDQIYIELPIKDRKELVVTGNDLMKWENRESGPWIKNTLEIIEKAVIEKKVANQVASIKEWLYS